MLTAPRSATPSPLITPSFLCPPLAWFYGSVDCVLFAGPAYDAQEGRGSGPAAAMDAVADAVAAVNAAPMAVGGGVMYYHAPRPPAAHPPRCYTIPMESEPARVLQALVWLGLGFLDAAHDLLQDLHSREASYAHCMLHRREGHAVGELGCTGFSNAHYWLGVLGGHPDLFPAVRARAVEAAAGRPDDPAVQEFAASITAGGWDADAFVDLMAACSGKGGAGEAFCAEVQHAEWALLVRHVHGLL